MIIVTAEGRSFGGIVAGGPADEVVVLQSTGERISIPKAEVEEIVASKTSVMPSGLLDSLAPQEISDLFTYFNQPARQSLTRRDEGTEQK
jgi:putative heme-binding domain-containing protein